MKEGITVKICSVRTQSHCHVDVEDTIKKKEPPLPAAEE